jgi:hypothetical protein
LQSERKIPASNRELIDSRGLVGVLAEGCYLNTCHFEREQEKRNLFRNSL